MERMRVRVESVNRKRGSDLVVAVVTACSLQQCRGKPAAFFRGTVTVHASSNLSSVEVAAVARGEALRYLDVR
jgi:hypothetical protein